MILVLNQLKYYSLSFSLSGLTFLRYQKRSVEIFFLELLKPMKKRLKILLIKKTFNQ
jgi:hypothetical protein